MIKAMPRWRTSTVMCLLVVGAFGLAGCGSSGPTTNAAASSGVKLTITYPSDGLVITSNTVAIRGTVQPDNATVQIQGQPAAVGNGVFTGTATLGSGQTTIDVVGSAPNETPTAVSITVSRAGSAKGRSKAPKGITVPKGAATSSTSSCGGDLSVASATTSCGFGQAVEAAYDGGGGATTIEATSPSTGQTYTMNCTQATPHICTGGNDAVVYFTSGPSVEPSTPSPPSATPPTALRSCAPSDPTISVDTETSCAFAAQAFIAYYRDWKLNGEQSSNTISATSPTTGSQYTMGCTNDGTTITCTGGNNIYITYPFNSIEIYVPPR